MAGTVTPGLPAAGNVSACPSRCSGASWPLAAASTSDDDQGGGLVAVARGNHQAGIIVPTGDINPVTVSDQGGLDMLGQTGEYLCFSHQDLKLKPVLATSWTPNSTSDVWTFKLRSGVKFHNGQPLTADDVVYTYKLQSDPTGKSNALSAFSGVLTPAGVKKIDDLTVQFTLAGAQRQLPLPVLVRQLQHDHHPEQLRPVEVADVVHRDRAVRLEELHGKRRRHLRAQRAVLGNEGAPRRDTVHLLFRPAGADHGPPIGHHRRHRPVLRERRRGAHRGRLQRHQAALERPPGAVDALRHGAVHRSPRPPGDRPVDQPARDRHELVQGLLRHRQRQPLRPGVPFHEHVDRPACPEHRTGEVAPVRRRPPIGLLDDAHHREPARDSRCSPRSSSSSPATSASTSHSRSSRRRRTTATPCSGSRTGSTPS